ncbi:MAG: hypothetical protein HYY84_10355 [Deltaproteobacteria bacterium]|nr:hypothetical protein [Deltaproteobacteria bacterium]
MKAADKALKRHEGVVHVAHDRRAKRVFVEFDDLRVKTADLPRVAKTRGCNVEVVPYHVRARGAEIRIGIGNDEAYIHPKSRLAVELSARKGVLLTRTVLDRTHATYTNDAERATFITFSVDGTSRRRGAHPIRARVVFFYCDDTICEKREAIVWPSLVAAKR